MKGTPAKTNYQLIVLIDFLPLPEAMVIDRIIDTNLKGLNPFAIDTEAVLVKKIGVKSNEFIR